ncbi:MAG TPA: NUDIX hydrolase [Burkholderiales bacterium]|nr:NUDIX hydrolase [Burkholderiales bacterium]
MAVWKPSVTVAAVIERDGRFLLIQEKIRDQLVLNQPAGHLDPGESLAAACRREAMEETAHHFEPTALVGIYRWRDPRRDFTFLRFAFHGNVGAAENRPLDKEIVAVHWLTPEEIRRRKAEHRSPLVQQCVDDFLAGRSYPLDVFSRDFS